MRALDLLRQKIPLSQELQKLQKAPEPVGRLTAKTPSCSFCSDRDSHFRWRKKRIGVPSASLAKQGRRPACDAPDPRLAQGQRLFLRADGPAGEGGLSICICNVVKEETMTDFRTAAQLFRLPEGFIRELHRRGLIGDPLSDQDLRGLKILSHIWHSPWFIRQALAGLSLAQRQELLFKPELTRVERYMLKCYLNAREGERIQTAEIISRVKRYLDVTVSEKQVRKIRAMAYDIRRGRRLDPARERERPEG
jgi:hypothetical protein